MDLSSIELPVFVSLTVILGTALVALLVDYLKGSNEQLREHNIELRVRREEDNRRSLTEIRLLREHMANSADLVSYIDHPRTGEAPHPEARPEAPPVVVNVAPAQPTPAVAPEVIEQAVERAVRSVTAEKPAEEPPPIREKSPAEAAAPVEVPQAPDSLLDHVIVATMPGGEVEHVVLYERPPVEVRPEREKKAEYVTSEEETYEPVVETAPTAKVEIKTEPAQAPGIPVAPPDVKAEPPEPLITAGAPIEPVSEPVVITAAAGRQEGPTPEPAPLIPAEMTAAGTQEPDTRQVPLPEPIPEKAQPVQVPLFAGAQPERGLPTSDVVPLPEPVLPALASAPLVPQLSPLEGVDRIVVIPRTAGSGPSIGPAPAANVIQLATPGLSAPTSVTAFQQTSSVLEAERIVVIPSTAHEALSIGPAWAGEIPQAEPVLVVTAHAAAVKHAAPLPGDERIVLMLGGARCELSREPVAVAEAVLPEPVITITTHVAAVKQASPVESADRTLVIPSAARSELLLDTPPAAGIKLREIKLAGSAAAASRSAASAGRSDRILVMPRTVRAESAGEPGSAAEIRLSEPEPLAPAANAAATPASPLESTGRIIVITRAARDGQTGQPFAAPAVDLPHPVAAVPKSPAPVAAASVSFSEDHSVAIPALPCEVESLRAAGPSPTTEVGPAAPAPGAFFAAAGETESLSINPEIPHADGTGTISEPGSADFFDPAVSAAPGATPRVKGTPASVESRLGPQIVKKSGLRILREQTHEAAQAEVRPAARLPRGVCETSEIDRFARSDEPISGVVIVVGVNDYPSLAQSQPKGVIRELSESIDRLIASLVTKEDFACRRSSEEFLVVFPYIGGAVAQRRIQHVAEKLWDFQLRSLASLPVLFSWGAAIVVDEGLSEALAIAIEEMDKTRNSRRGFDVTGMRPRRRAVNF